MKCKLYFLMFLLTMLVTSFGVQAQLYHEDEKADLRAFLRQSSGVTGQLNLERAGLVIADTLDWQTSEAWVGKTRGLSWNDATPKRLITISWYDSDDNLNLSGNLILGNCLALKQLSCAENKLTSLDVSKNIAMTELYCAYNQLTTLYLGNALKNLSCPNNRLTSLDISKCTVLSQMWCTNNRLIALDVSKNTALIYINCGNNQLTTMDISTCTVLNEMWCSNNRLTSLDVSKNTALRSLYCGDNQLTTLDVSKNIALQYFDCSYNRLPLSQLYPIVKQTMKGSKRLSSQDSVFFETKTLQSNEVLNLSSEAAFDGVNTVFTVTKGKNNAIEGTDYSITDGIITFITKGTYTVKMTNTAIATADATTGSINVARGTGMESITTQQKGIKIYPNPVAGGQATIASCPLNEMIEVYSLTGKLLAKYSATDEKTEINVAHLPGGVYFVKVGNETVKMVKQ